MNLVRFRDEDDVHIAVAVEIGGSDMLAVVHHRAESVGLVNELARTIIEVEAVHSVLDRYHRVEVAILVHID